MSNRFLTRRRIGLAAAAVVVAGGARAQPTADDPAQLVAVMERYAAALRTNNVEGLVALYAPDGVFIRENLPPVQGTEALRAAYRQVFATLKLDVGFQIAETEVAGDMAWLRTVSSGRIRTLATGAEQRESFNELVVFRRIAGTWKIRAYLYASSKPGSGVPQ